MSTILCIAGVVVSAGTGNKISVWKSGRDRPDDASWTMHKFFDTAEAGVWSLAVWKGRLISGGVDGTVRVWT